MEKLNVSTNEQDEIVIFKIDGPVDTTTASAMENTFDTVFKNKKYKFIVDLAGSEYVSSAGWGIFVGIKKTLQKNNGDIKLASMKSEVLEVYEVLDFTHILEYYKDIQSAVKAFKKKK